MHKGSCLCGAVSVAVEGDLPPAGACHCSQCRRMSGHYWATTTVPEAALSVGGADKVAWFDSSPAARRAFCSVCGSTLFWKARSGEEIAISMGLFEAPTGTKLGNHIFVADKGDYYDITDGLPQELH